MYDYDGGIAWPGPVVDSNGRLERGYALAIKRLIKAKVP